MNNNNQNSMSPLLAALVGGIAGAVVVYLSDDKRRKNIKEKYQELVEDGKDSTDELKIKFDKTLKSGRKSLAKKIRQVENRVAQS